MGFDASTPVATEVVEIMRNALETGHGNPSSSHWTGIAARQMVENARTSVADLLGCLPQEIVFTSGGSEANNHALKGVFFPSEREGPHFFTSSAEHPAIVAPLRFLERLSARLAWLPVNGTGLVDLVDLKHAMTIDTVLVTIMHANNETGTLQPIAACAAIARDYDVHFHTDAAQTVGKIPTRVCDLGVDLLTVARHKFHARKRVGALYIRDGLVLEPFIHGAGHESGRRAGTESAMLAAAFGVAASLSADLEPMEQVQALGDRFWAALKDAFGDSVVHNGLPERCLPNTLNVAFVSAEILAFMLELAASTGSSCHSGRVELSPVLEAMGVTPRVGMGAIRFSLGRTTTVDEVGHVVARLRRVLR